MQPMPTPTATSASRTLTAAMMPSRRLVVPRSPVIDASKRRRLMRRRIAAGRFFANRAAHFIQQLPAFVRHAGRLVNGRSEALELAREVFDRRLELPPQRSSASGEEEVAHDSANPAAGTGPPHRPRVTLHPASIWPHCFMESAGP